MIRFINIKKQYKITSMYLLNPFILPQWPEQTSQYSTYFNISADNGVIVDKYGKTITNNGATVANESGINCINFNGTSNYIYIPNIDVVNPANGLFMTAVLKINTLSGIKGICGKTRATNAISRYGIYLDTITESPKNVWAYLGANSNMAANKYEYPSITGKKIVVTFLSKIVGTTCTSKLYINGNLVNTQIGVVSSYSEVARYLIGAYGDAAGTGIYPNTYLDGKIYNIMQGSGTLTDADVLAQYNYLKSKYQTV